MKKNIYPFRRASKDSMEAPLKSEPQCDRPIVIEREEYDALMSEMPAPEDTPSSPELNERVKKIEFFIMIIVGLILVVFLLCQRN